MNSKSQIEFYLNKDWSLFLSSEIRQPYFKSLKAFLNKEYNIITAEEVIDAVKNKKSARELVSALKKNTTTNDETIYKTTSGHIKKGGFSKKIDMELFSKKKNAHEPDRCKSPRAHTL